MKDLGLFIGILILIVVLSVTAKDRKPGGLFANLGTSTPVHLNQGDYGSGFSERNEPTYYQGDTSRIESQEEIEKKVASIYAKLDTLREDLRKAELWEPVSPYKDLIILERTQVGTKDPDEEYLTLNTKRHITENIKISGWTLESYVTDETAFVPRGDRLLLKWRSPAEENIVLSPGESAYLITGDSPINTSFRENICTGYLSEKKDFRPSLRNSCPRPTDELERDGSIELDNDKCYDFVRRIGTCETPEETMYTRSKVGSSCKAFIENTFNYDDCVRIHRHDPFFYRDGYWRIYLDERSDLWRHEREIIRLLDENDRVVSVIEY